MSDDILETAKQLAAEHVRDSFLDDLRIAAQALRAASWPDEMGREMEYRANRLDFAASLLDPESVPGIALRSLGVATANASTKTTRGVAMDGSNEIASKHDREERRELIADRSDVLGFARPIYLVEERLDAFGAVDGYELRAGDPITGPIIAHIYAKAGNRSLISLDMGNLVPVIKVTIPDDEAT